jgi:hypothetical protein
MTYCVYCGAALADPDYCQSCGAHRGVDGTWQQGSGPAHAPVAAESGWRPDPTGRHEGRYFAAGEPTDLVRDGTTEAIDPIGKEQLTGPMPTGAVVADSIVGARRKWPWIVGALLAVVLIGAGVGLTLYVTRDKQTVDDKFLAAVRQAGLSGEFNSNANAIAHGRQVCRKLADGGPQQGMPVDQVAVEYYCPQFAEGFHVLETATITGSFTLKDDSPSYAYPSIKVSAASCTGAGGYSDIGAGTQVTVKNGKGDVLTTSELQPGEGGSLRCSFPFTFNVTEGEDRYIVSVGRRGELSFSFGELKSRGVALFLG